MRKLSGKMAVGQLSLFGDENATTAATPPQALTKVAAAMANCNPRSTRLRDTDLARREDRQRETDNNAAIAALVELEASDAPFTASQKEALLRFNGFGGQGRNLTDYYRSNAARKAMAPLGADTFDLAADASLTAYYTPPAVIRAMWDGVARLGFTGGRVLEPTCGTGAFIGFAPETVLANSRFVGIEKERVSAKIARQFYPDADIREGTLESQRLPDCGFDLVIGNVPFANAGVHDPEFRKHSFVLHDYVIAKSLRKCRAGGLVALITSAGTMDKKSTLARTYFAQNAELVAAWRLPNGVFSGYGAEVMTDVLFFRKRARPLEIASDAWVTTRSFEFSREPSFQVNPIFCEENSVGTVCGEYGVQNSAFGKVLACEFGNDSIAETLAQRVTALPERTGVREDTPIEFVLAERAERSMIEGEFVLIEAPNAAPDAGHADLRIVTNGLLTRPEAMPEKTELRIVALCRLKKLVKSLLAAQVAEDTDALCDALRGELNASYDAFVKSFGAIGTRPNQLAFEEDPSFPMLLALELWDELNEAFTKAPIFSKRTTFPGSSPSTAETLEEAIEMSEQQFGYVEKAYTAKLLGVSVEDVDSLVACSDLAFEDPTQSRLVSRAAYLSGNVREKLANMLLLAVTEPRFAKNVVALQGVQPAWVDSRSIFVQLGAPWLPPEVIKAFAPEISVSVRECAYHAIDASWTIETSTQYAESNFGTSKKTAFELLNCLLNGKQIVVTESVAGRDVVNPTETLAARTKAEDIQAQFAQWVWADAERSTLLEGLYNERFNAYVARVYDGAAMRFPRMSDVYVPRASQVNCVYRALMSGNMMIPHPVGFGKTLILCAIAMKSRQTGRANKPMIVVKNNTLLQFTAEFMRVYPDAQVLMMSKDDFTKEKRKQFVAKIAMNDWDAIIAPHSVFDRIGVSDAAKTAFVNETLNRIEMLLFDANWSERKRLLLKQKKLETKLKAVLSGPKDEHIFFEELGVDLLMIDEAHAYKNLGVETKRGNISGLQTGESKKAMETMLKVRHVNTVNGGQRGVIFATGTPITNTLTEAYVMMRYLQPQLLEEVGLTHFDAWASLFGQTVNGVEVAPDGSGFRVSTRFSRFNNLPELVALTGQAWDTLDLAKFSVPAPEIKGGAVEIVSSPKSEALAIYVESLVERAVAVRNKDVTPEEDNFLKIVSDGRKAALDMRLVKPGSIDEPKSKCNMATRRLYEIWSTTTEERSTQLVFCDLSVPTRGVWNVYEEIAAKLVDRGVPADQIAFIHDFDSDAAKEKLFRRVNGGQVRILFGSTEKMGVGTNVQRRVIAIHHLDGPWRPDGIVQRDGRGLRPGNLNAAVSIIRYVTEGSFDAYVWQGLERKSAFISSFMRGQVNVRACEDLDEQTLSYSEIKAIASGNPAVRERVMLQAEVLKRAAVVRDERKRLNWLTSTIASAPKRLEALSNRAANVRIDAALVVDLSADKFCCEIQGQVVRERKVAGEAIMNALRIANKERTQVRQDVVINVGRMCGFAIKVEATAFETTLWVVGALRYPVVLAGDGVQQAMAVQRVITQLPASVGECEREIKRIERDIVDSEAALDKLPDSRPALAALETRLEELDASLQVLQPA